MPEEAGQSGKSLSQMTDGVCSWRLKDHCSCRFCELPGILAGMSLSLQGHCHKMWSCVRRCGHTWLSSPEDVQFDLWLGHPRALCLRRHLKYNCVVHSQPLQADRRRSSLAWSRTAAMLCPSSLSATHACVPSQDALTHLKAETGTSFQRRMCCQQLTGEPRPEQKQSCC